MVKKTKRKYYFKAFAWFYLIYGIIFLIVDRFDYASRDSYLTTGIVSNFYPESFEFKSINLFFTLLFFIASYLLLKNRKEAWYLYNISFIGIILKYLTTFLFTLSYSNILAQVGFHFLITVFGLVFINLKRSRRKLKIKLKSYILNFIILIIFSSGIIFLYAYEEILPYEHDYKKHYREIIYETPTFKNIKIDTCKYAYDFLEIIDTLKEIQDYSLIKFTDFDSISNTTYTEILSSYHYSFFALYDTLELSMMFIPEIDSDYLLSDFTTNIYLYNYIAEIINNDDINKKMYLSEDSLMINDKDFILNLDKNKEIKKIFFSNSINNQIEIHFKYNSFNKIIRADIFNEARTNRHSIELFYYNENNQLSRSIIYHLKYNSSKQKLNISKGITIYKSPRNYFDTNILDSIDIDAVQNEETIKNILGIDTNITFKFN